MVQGGEAGQREGAEGGQSKAEQEGDGQNWRPGAAIAYIQVHQNTMINYVTLKPRSLEACSSSIIDL